MFVGKRFCTVLGLVALLAAVAVPKTSYAVPTLQLDILGGFYVGLPEETIMTGDSAFTVIAYATPGSVSEAEILADTYYLSVALRPKTGPLGESFGSFTIEGPGSINNGTHDGTSIGSAVTVSVTGDMTYGVPPVDATGNPLLGDHGIFETYFLEIEFQFVASDTADTRNTQDNPGEPLGAGPGSFFAAFDFDISGLSDDVELHGDLYNTKVKSGPAGDIVRDDFAPFSHDVETIIPEPASMVVWGLLVSLGLYVGCRRRRRAA